ncbi:transposase family protein [Streptomyces sp. NPDC005141]
MCRQSATVCLVKSPALEVVAGLSLAERLRVLPDPRRRRGVRYPFVAVLLVTASAVVAGARSYAAIGQWSANALWREERLKPHRSGTFRISKDPAFAEKVADVVGLYLAPPGGAVALSMIQALDRTQPVLPVAFAATEKRTHDYVRHGTTNLFATLNVGTGKVIGECKPSRNGQNFLAFLQNFLAFLKKAVKAACEKGDPCRPGQPLHPHHAGGEGIAGQELPRPLSLHPRRVFLDQSDRDLVRKPDQAVDPPQHLRERQRPDHADPQLHRLLELRGKALHLDRDPPARSWRRCDSSRPTSRSSSRTTQSDANRITRH